MAVDKFKFVSPGVFVNEIDESILEPLPERMGPLVIGRFEKGPANRPIRVNSFKEFVSIFGAPSDGSPHGDVFREGALTAPTYAAYAAQAWLKNNSPCTIYRVLGENKSDATTFNGTAGWKTHATTDFSSPSSTAVSAGGAYGMFVFPSASSGTEAVTGTLGAIWYVPQGGVILTGTTVWQSQSQGCGEFIKASSAGLFTAKISGSSGVAKHVSFDFNRDSKSFIRKVFNTDPTKTNSTITSDTEIYWLGETFESNVTYGENPQLLVTSSIISSRASVATIMALDGTEGASNIIWANHKQTAKAAQTGWFFSQDHRGQTASFDPEDSSHVEKLFKFIALDSGESANRDLKISIQDLKMSATNFDDFGTFTVLIRKATDNDNRPVVLERFSGVNLNPKSLNFIERVIGDRHYNYSEDNKTITTLGNYPNRSKFARVEVAKSVKQGQAKAGWLPFGVYGPVVPKTLDILSGSSASGLVNSWYETKGAVPTDFINQGANHPATVLIHAPHNTTGANTQYHFTASVQFPVTRTRISSSEGGLQKANKAYFGYQSNVKDTKRFDPTNYDILRGQPAGHDPHTKGAKNQYSWVFTLDDIEEASEDRKHAIHAKNSRRAGNSYTAKSGSGYVLTGTLAGYDRFTSPMFGGFDGFDITEKDPFRNAFVKTTQGERTNYAFFSLKKAIDVTSDAEFVEYDVLAMPGITNPSLNNQLISSCEERGDALAIVDLEGNYTPDHASTSDEKDRLGSVEEVVNAARDLNVNSSYGCTFYPFVQIRDSISDSVLYVPPSVVALGTFSSSQRKSAVWFAPAGFTRGGLSEGSAGLPVIGVRERVVADDRDRLYDANINPIATFPAEGIVIFGQKTLQVTPSALDRINVRRLLIHVKKEISRMAATTLFEQNVQATWDRFKGRVVPFLESVQSGLGLTDFRVVLDSTTTTPDLIDRNILYAKIYLKPARSIEFIALDFIITKTGASFDD
jgi:hypothetical protein